MTTHCFYKTDETQWTEGVKYRGGWKDVCRHFPARNATSISPSPSPIMRVVIFWSVQLKVCNRISNILNQKKPCRLSDSLKLEDAILTVYDEGTCFPLKRHLKIRKIVVNKHETKGKHLIYSDRATALSPNTSFIWILSLIPCG